MVRYLLSHHEDEKITQYHELCACAVQSKQRLEGVIHVAFIRHIQYCLPVTTMPYIFRECDQISRDMPVT